MEGVELREFELSDLEQYNGQDGKPTYVLVDGKIYDVSDSKLWKNGKHMNKHQAARDSSDSFNAAPHGKDILVRFPQVGILKQTTQVDKLPIPGWLNTLLEKYPFFKRHPHPMVVHFPMTFSITSSIFLLWYYIISPLSPLLNAIYYLHILGTISLPFALFTGWLSWKVNYMGKPMGYITKKIVLSLFVSIVDIVVLLFLIHQPDILANPQGIQMLLPILIISYLPIVSLIGFYGGQLVYY